MTNRVFETKSLEPNLEQSLTKHRQAVEQMLEKSGATEEEVKGLKAQLNELEQKLARPMGNGSLTTPTPTALETFLNSPQLKSIRDGAKSTGLVGLQGLSTKDITSGSFKPPAATVPGIQNDPRRPLGLLDFLPSIQVNVGAFEYVALADADNQADYQANEGDLKAESNPTFSDETANIATVAHWIRTSIQVLDDNSALGQQVGNLLEYGVKVKLENQLINGTGVGKTINGLINQGQAKSYTSTEVPMSNPSLLDALGRAVAEMRAEGWQPTLVVINPMDLYKLEYSKDGDSNYVLSSITDKLDLPAVTSSALPEGQALVIDSSQTVILDRMAPQVQASREDRDNFVTNRVTLLAELRAGLAVFAPGAVYVVDANVTS